MDQFAGRKEVTFKLVGTDIKKAVLTAWKTSVPYTGEEIVQTPVLSAYSADGLPKTLTEHEDYEVEYKNNRKVGKATVTFTGINGYSGKLTKTFQITAYDIAQDTEHAFMVQSGITIPYAKGASKPEPKVTFRGTLLQAGVDYKLSYRNNTAVSDGSGTKVPTVIVTGKGNYKGKRKVPFQISQKGGETLTVNAADKVFKNVKKAWKSTPSVYDTDGKKLTAGKDYDKNWIYTYAEDTVLENGSKRTAGDPILEADIPPAGTLVKAATVGIGNYGGTIEGKYRIVRTDISKAKVTIAAQEYTGNAIELSKAQITVKVGKEVLDPTDFEIVSYKKNTKKGTATVELKGIGNYGGVKNASFKIKAKGFLWWWRS